MATDSKMVDDLLRVLDKINAMHRVVYQANIEIRNAIKDAKLTNGNMVDIAFLISKVEALCDDTRKECGTTKLLLDEVVCAMHVMSLLANGDKEQALEGCIAIGTPSADYKATGPKHNTPEWSQLLNWMGVPEEYHGAVSLHWPSFCLMMKELAAAGKPYPPGQDPNKVYVKWSLQRLHLRKGLDLNDLLETARTEVKAKQ